MFLHGKFNRSQNISIHSLRMEGDNSLRTVSKGLFNFNPLPPHGGRQIYPASTTIQSQFQSTPSAWRETIAKKYNDLASGISIHSLRMEGDSHCDRLFGSLCAFQSTPSAWRETAKLHRKAFFISPILVQSCKKGCKRLHSAPEKMVFFEKREKNLVRNLQHLSVRL